VIGAVSITKNNILQTRNAVSGVTTPSSTSVSLGSWHTLEYRINVAGPSGSSQVWLDGKEVPGLTITSNYGSNLVGLTVIGDQHLSRSFDVAYDNFTVDASP